MKIVHVCSSDITAYFLLRSQLSHFSKCGAEVKVICSNGPWINALLENNIAVDTIKISRVITPIGDLKSLLKMIRLFKKDKPDIVHTHTMKGALLGLIASIIAGVPVRFNTIHGFFFSEESSKLKKILFINLERFHAKLSTHTMCQNPIDTALAIKLHIVAEKLISTIGNGIDIEKFSRKAVCLQDTEICRRTLNIAKDDFVVGIIARMVREKGYIELAKAFQMFRMNKDNVKLLIIGEPDLTKPDKITIDSLKRYVPEDAMRHLSHTDNVPLYLSCMSVYVLPSYREGFPRSVLEAAAMDLPVIVAESNGGRVAVEHNVTGYLVPVGKNEEIAGYLEILYRDEKKRRAMGIAAREKAIQDFNEANVFTRIWELYNRFYKVNT